MKLPSQLDCISMLEQLEELEEKGTIERNNTSEDDVFPDSCSTWLLSQLKGAFNIKSPAFFPFPCSSKEMFSWVERNNQISEEVLRSLIYDEEKLKNIKSELTEYSEDIPNPKQIKLRTPTPIDTEFLEEIEELSSKKDIKPKEKNSYPNCFIWQWGSFNAFIAPQEFDFLRVNEFKKELSDLGLHPDAFVLMPYSSNPMEQIDQCYGNELWHTFPPEEPLLWEETKVYLEALRCQSFQTPNLTTNQRNQRN
jgi:hypothetical protein